ncbi:6-phospho-beta-glucosidase [Flavobacterium ustbae]|uniref:6-phospho-beta-glucosidase n=1 Tax=Flavobacterium ustbae TaxID=2488790 RepID=UPI000F771F98|nr:6-phospho-beta-glucosidase [Flavobacterium ustbae]
MEYLEKKENLFNYWLFIEEYYPNYSSCDNVLLSDILTRKLEGEEVCSEDDEYIKDWDVRKELFEVHKELLCKAFENYFNTVYPENTNLFSQ